VHHTLPGGRQGHWIKLSRSAYWPWRLDAGKKSVVLSG